jgi:hypothetical protein
MLAPTVEHVTDRGIKLTTRKTAADAELPLWRETPRVLARYRTTIGIGLLPGTPLIRSRGGTPYPCLAIGSPGAVSCGGAGVTPAACRAPRL